MSAAFDSVILIDYLRSFEPARRVIRDERGARIISIVAWIEVMAGAFLRHEEEFAEEFLRRFDVIPVDTAVGREAMQQRAKLRLKLPDAIIFATAIVHGVDLVTRNTKDFPEGTAGVRVPYRL